MNTKKIVLVTALLMVAFVFVVNNPIMFGFCQNISDYGTGTKYCSDASFGVPEAVSLLGLFLGSFLLLLSLITYKMREEVFRAWWGFARWWVPVIIVVTLLLNNASGGGTLGMDRDFTAFILIVLYSVLVVTCLVKIVRAYLKTKHT
jgi:hypothetical protein